MKKKPFEIIRTIVIIFIHQFIFKMSKFVHWDVFKLILLTDKQDYRIYSLHPELDVRSCDKNVNSPFEGEHRCYLH